MSRGAGPKRHEASCPRTVVINRTLAQKDVAFPQQDLRTLAIVVF